MLKQCLPSAEDGITEAELLVEMTQGLDLGFNNNKCEEDVQIKEEPDEVYRLEKRCLNK